MTIQRINLFTPGGYMPADAFNKMQERGLAQPSKPATGHLHLTPFTTATPVAVVTPVGDLMVTTITGGPGGGSFYGFSAAAGIPAAEMIVINDDIDWRDRYLSLEYAVHASVDRLPGGASENSFVSGAIAHNASTHGRLLYTSNGIDDGAGANPANGAPPAAAGTAGDFSAALLAAGNDLHLYVERLTPFRLCVYNSNVAARWLALWLRTTPKLGMRP